MTRSALAKTLFAQGLSTKEVAYEMGISYNTAKCHKYLLGLTKPWKRSLRVKNIRCPRCRKTFFPVRDSRKFCSQKCANSYVRYAPLCRACKARKCKVHYKAKLCAECWNYQKKVKYEKRLEKKRQERRYYGLWSQTDTESNFGCIDLTVCVE